MEIAILVIQLVLLVAAAYLPSYLNQKGKNLAKREDIDKITTIVEGIRRENSEKLEALSQQNRIEIKRLDQVNDLRLAALGERLKAYQEAYSLVFKMLSTVGSRSEEVEVLNSCTDFWQNRSLYISEQAREAFDKAMAALNAQQSTLQSDSPVSATENRAKITNALRVIERSVNLPEFSSEVERDDG